MHEFISRLHPAASLEGGRFQTVHLQFWPTATIFQSMESSTYVNDGGSMLTVKDAVQAAEEWVRDLYPQSALKHLRLEEVQLSEDEKTWHITLGWAEPGVRVNGLAAALNREVTVLPRVYKTLDVDAESGGVRSMKIREVDG